jgi:hypothetical protein
MRNRVNIFEKFFQQKCDKTKQKPLQLYSSFPQHTYVCTVNMPIFIQNFQKFSYSTVNKVKQIYSTYPALRKRRFGLRLKKGIRVHRHLTCFYQWNQNVFPVFYSAICSAYFDLPRDHPTYRHTCLVPVLIIACRVSCPPTNLCMPTFTKGSC